MKSGRQSRQKMESHRTRLTEAITNGRLYQTKMILTDVTNLNYLDDEGMSPLMRAFMLEDSKHRTRSAMVKLLLQHKADVNLRDKNGQHVLNLACKMNKSDLVNLLLTKCLQDVELTSQDHKGNTPLIYAVINNNVNVVKLLVNVLKKFSLSVDQRNNLDETAYLKALELGFNECASILSQVGKASQDIEVNPFQDFLPISNTGSSRQFRVRSAPLPKYSRQEWKDSEQFTARKTPWVNGSLFHGKQTYFTQNKRQSNKLFKSGKIHNIVSQKSQNVKSKTKPKSANGERSSHVNIKILVEDNVLNLTKDGAAAGTNARKSLRTSRKDSSEKKKDPLLRLLLDQSPSQCSSVQSSPRNRVSHTSCNEIVKAQSKAILPTTPGNKLMASNGSNGYNTAKRPFDENAESHRKSFPSYHSYLLWKASLDHPLNSLRGFLALRAEQHSEGSSYRKGLVIPKYDPTSDESAGDRSGGATSPNSERSGKSEASRKISAVAKTVGLSIYLNKRKILHKKDNSNNS